MEKKIITVSDLKGARTIAAKQYTVISKLSDGSILKVFNPGFLLEQKSAGIDIEAKILDAVPLENSPEIIVPNYAAYDNCGRFLGIIVILLEALILNLIMITYQLDNIVICIYLQLFILEWKVL